MKKNILYSIFVIIAFSACKKQQSPDNKKITQRVTINVAFSKSVSDFNSAKVKTSAITTLAADTALSNYISTIWYMVFDETGKNVHNSFQANTLDNFGHYNDNLAPGNYTLIVAGGGSKLSVQSGTLNEQYIYETNYNAIKSDIFYKKINFTVGNSNSSVNVDLDRISSKIALKIKDAIPNDVEYITLTINKAVSEYYVGSKLPTSNGSVTSFTLIPVTSANRTNFTTEIPFIISSSPVEIGIKAGKGQTNYVVFTADRTIDNVTVEPNTVTVLSGNLFGGNASDNGMTVHLDTTWTNVYHSF